MNAIARQQTRERNAAADRAFRHDLLGAFRKGRDTQDLAAIIEMPEHEIVRHIDLARAEEMVA